MFSINVSYVNVHYSRERSFLFRGNSTIRYNYKPNEHTIYGFWNSYFKKDRYFDKTNKKSGNYI